MFGFKAALSAKDAHIASLESQIRRLEALVLPSGRPQPETRVETLNQSNPLYIFPALTQPDAEVDQTTAEERARVAQEAIELLTGTYGERQ